MVNSFELAEAVQQGNLTLVEHLLQEGATPDSHDEHWGHALSLAVNCKFEDPRIIECLLRNGADPNIEDRFRNVLESEKRYMPEQRDSWDIDGINRLLNARTPLYQAARKTETSPETLQEILLMLLHHGANLHWREPVTNNSIWHVTATTVAARVLLQHHADAGGSIDDIYRLRNHRQRTIVHEIVAKVASPPYPELLQFWLERQPCEEWVNTTDDCGRTALHWAARNGQVECARILLQNGCDVNHVDDSGYTAAFRAFGNVDMENLIIDEYAADLNPPMKENGYRVLHYLIFETRNYQAARFLLRNGVDVNCKTTNQKRSTPLHLLVGTKTAKEFVNGWELLEKFQPKTTVRDGNGLTALEAACISTESSLTAVFEMFRYAVRQDTVQIHASWAAAPLVNAKRHKTRKQMTTTRRWRHWIWPFGKKTSTRVGSNEGIPSPQANSKR